VNSTHLTAKPKNAMKRSIHASALPRLLFFTFTLLVVIFSCTKQDVHLQQQEDDVEKFLALPGNAGSELKSISAWFKKENSKEPFLQDFIRKNGIPVWDKTLSNLPSLRDQDNPGSRQQAGVFFIPLKKQNGNTITAYIVVYKYSNGSYRFKTYNKEENEAIQPITEKDRNDAKQILSIFGYFEKIINNNTLTTVGPTRRQSYQGTGMKVREAVPEAGTSALTFACLRVFQAEVQITYPDGMVETGIYTVVINDCPPPSIGNGDNGGGNNGGNNGGPNNGGNNGNPPTGGGGGGGNNNGGTTGTGSNTLGPGDFNPAPGGTPQWNPACHCFGFDPWNNPPGNQLNDIVEWVNSSLNLNTSQQSWLDNNRMRAYEIYHYMQGWSSQQWEESMDIVTAHINLMMTNSQYLTFVENHDNLTANGLVWWEDTDWLSHPVNFNLDIDATNQQYDELTVEEKILVAFYPTQAFAIRNNVPKAFAMSTTMMVQGTGLNDRMDAFRHAYFQAINTRDVPDHFDQRTYMTTPGYVIVDMFASAHESEVPAVLNLEKTMDLFNNKVGIEYCHASCNGSSTDTQIAFVIRNRLDQGYLRYLFPLDLTTHGLYDANPHDHVQDCPTCTNGIIPGVTSIIQTNR
jgi:hypothetical protein